MKKKIDIGGIDPVLFVGLNDQNIKILENFFQSKIVVRGNRMNIDGSNDEIKDIERIVQNMLALINKNGSIDKKDINELISFNNSKNKQEFNENDPVILHAHSGPIFARTDGQKKYLTAVRYKHGCTTGMQPAKCT